MKIKAITALPIAIALTFAVVALVALVGAYAPAYAQEQTEERSSGQEQQSDAQNEEQAAEENNEESTDDEQATADTVYRYVAQSGDSYSKIARKAVQTYGLKSDVNLSQAQILYAETNLTQEAGSPLLALGQNIEVSEATVASWVERAENLADDAEAMWAPYTEGVNFNTDNVGESRS